MRATVIVDNIESSDLPGEWGLSIFIEHREKKILLDAGASDLFVRNAEALNLPLDQVDFAVLSHAHYDHANGLDVFFQVNEAAPCYTQSATEEDCYAKFLLYRRYIGIPKGLLERHPNRIIKCDTARQISEGVHVLPHTTKGLSAIGKREHMWRKTSAGWRPDNFAHEQSLVFETDKGLVIFNSCSHGGAAAIVREVQEAFPGRPIYGIIGGFHIYNKSDREIRSLAKRLKDTGIQYVCTGHCSGEKGYSILREELGEMVEQLHVGLVMEF